MTKEDWDRGSVVLVLKKEECCERFSSKVNFWSSNTKLCYNCLVSVYLLISPWARLHVKVNNSLDTKVTSILQLVTKQLLDEVEHDIVIHSTIHSTKKKKVSDSRQWVELIIYLSTCKHTNRELDMITLRNHVLRSYMTWLPMTLTWIFSNYWIRLS